MNFIELTLDWLESGVNFDISKSNDNNKKSLKLDISSFIKLFIGSKKFHYELKGILLLYYIVKDEDTK